MCEQSLLSETTLSSNEQYDGIDEVWDLDAKEDWLRLSLKLELVANDDSLLL